ncbi:lipoprotein [Streptomyces pseudoechinosporeus]
MTCRPTLLAAITLTAAAALTLSACGSGDSDSSKDNDKIAGADTGSEESPSPSGSATDAFDRPQVKLPSDVTDKYEDWKTGDDTKDAVLADTARRIDATNDAILRGDTGAPGLSFYYRDKALTGAVEWVQAYVDANLSFTGTTRYYAPQVTLSGEKSASVVYCSDESKGFNKDRKTNKVDKTPSGESPYVLYNTRLEKNGQGVWQTTNLISKRGDKKCG